jgi:hypothetical protein
MTIINNKIYASRDSDSYYIAVRDNSQKENRRQTCHMAYDNGILKVSKSDFPTEITSRMVNDVERNMKFIKKVL